MKTNGEASKTHTGGSVSCCLQPLGERQAGTSILRMASPSGQELSELAGRRRWCSLIIFEAPQDFLTLLNICERLIFRQFEEMDFLTPKASKLIHQSNRGFSFQSIIAASTDTIALLDHSHSRQSWREHNACWFPVGAVQRCFLSCSSCSSQHDSDTFLLLVFCPFSTSLIESNTKSCLSSTFLTSEDSEKNAWPRTWLRHWSFVYWLLVPKAGVRFLVQMLFQQGSNYTPEGGVEVKEGWDFVRGAKQEAMVENILVRMWVCEKITGRLCLTEGTENELFIRSDSMSRAGKRLFWLCALKSTHLDDRILVKMLENLGRTLIKAERLLFPVVLPSSVASKLHAIQLIRKVRRLKLWF